jgi:hypothetical protein
VSILNMQWGSGRKHGESPSRLVIVRRDSSADGRERGVAVGWGA